MTPRLLAICAVVFSISSVADARLLELTFDDAKAGSGVATGEARLANMEKSRAQLGVEPATATLVGSAVRSALSAGRYGRAAAFPDGAGHVLIAGIPQVSQSVTAFFWVKAKTLTQGTLFEAVGLFKLLVDKSTLQFEIAQDGGSAKRVSLGAFPTDGDWHHLTLTVDRSASTPKLSVEIDASLLGSTTSALVKPAVGTPDVLLGEGFSGWIDELLIKPGLPNDSDLFDRSPTHCPAGLTCQEEVLTITPTGFTHEVPVRFKSIYDSSLCSVAKPCPLLFDVSGGNDCADDYQSPASVARFAKAGFFVVTGDAYCEADSSTQPYPTETSQYIAIKEHVRSKSPLKGLIKTGPYHASGCSHGAGMVTVWMLHEADHPTRTYARSPPLDGLCVHANLVTCPAVHAEREAAVAETQGRSTIDWEHASVKKLQAVIAAPEHISAEIARSREFALSWGINLSGPVCNADGSFACNEEGQWGMNWSARRFRDTWTKREPKGQPTGFFVEDHNKDCQHCAPTDSQAFACGLCLLRHGRAGMATECASCLDYSGSEIEPGAAAGTCDILASWYSDPLVASATDGGLRDAGVTDGGSVDDGGARPSTAGGGCCSMAGASPSSSSALALLLLVALCLTRRRRRNN